MCGFWHRTCRKLLKRSGAGDIIEEKDGSSACLEAREAGGCEKRENICQKSFCVLRLWTTPPQCSPSTRRMSFRPRVQSEYDAPTLEEFTRRIRTFTEKLPWLVCIIDGEVAGYGYAGSAPHPRRVSVVGRNLDLRCAGLAPPRHRRARSTPRCSRCSRCRATIISMSASPRPTSAR